MKAGVACGGDDREAQEVVLVGADGGECGAGGLRKWRLRLGSMVAGPQKQVDEAHW